MEAEVSGVCGSMPLMHVVARHLCACSTPLMHVAVLSAVLAVLESLCSIFCRVSSVAITFGWLKFFLSNSIVSYAITFNIGRPHPIIDLNLLILPREIFSTPEINLKATDIF